MNFGEIQDQALRLLGLTKSTTARDDLPFWTNAGVEDAFRSARPAWAIRAATVAVDADGALRTPPSYIGFKSIFPSDGGLPLQFVTPEQGGLMLGIPWPGWASSVMMEGDLVTILPFPPAGMEFRTSYWSRLEPLSDPADTNLWTQRASALLIYGICRHAALQMQDDEGIQRFDMGFNSAIDSLEFEAKKANTGSGLVITRVPKARTGYAT